VSGRDLRRATPALPALLLAVLGGVLVAQRQGLWYDELYTAELARTPLLDVLRAIGTGTGTAPFLDGIPPSYNGPYYVVVHLWLALTPFGPGEVGLRALSLVAAVAAAAVLTAAVTRLARSRAAGLAAGLALAANPLVVEYAAEARGYGLALLATAATLLGLARWLDGRSLLLYGVGGAAMGLAHWFALPVLGAFAVAALVLRRRAGLPLVGVTVLAALPTLALVGSPWPTARAVRTSASSATPAAGSPGWPWTPGPPAAGRCWPPRPSPSRSRCAAAEPPWSARAGWCSRCSP
jgi:4-amino-4-deoxy-L-arabinose transferase-like glycosyltransferase